jgi:hypothetical protein
MQQFCQWIVVLFMVLVALVNVNSALNDTTPSERWWTFVSGAAFTGILIAALCGAGAFSVLFGE